MLQFDEATARLLEDAYQGADATRRRRANFDALDPRPGETVVDIGCGPGLLTEDLARAVGPRGRVVAVDPSAEMRARAEARSAARECVAVAHGTADALPLADGAADRAVALQVFEYLSDIPAALTETARVLRPGGRLVVGDWHWDMLVWRSDDPDRMARVLAAWDHHLADRTVPETLPGRLAEAGFRLTGVTPVAYVDTTLRPDGLAEMMRHLIRAYVVQEALIDAAEAEAWAAEQPALAAAGRVFFSAVHYVIAADRL